MRGSSKNPSKAAECAIKLLLDMEPASVSIKQVKNHFIKEGYAANYAWTMIGRLVKEGRVKRIKKGEYVWVG